MIFPIAVPAKPLLARRSTTLSRQTLPRKGAEERSQPERPIHRRKRSCSHNAVTAVAAAGTLLEPGCASQPNHRSPRPRTLSSNDVANVGRPSNSTPPPPRPSESPRQELRVPNIALPPVKRRSSVTSADLSYTRRRSRLSGFVLPPAHTVAAKYQRPPRGSLNSSEKLAYLHWRLAFISAARLMEEIETARQQEHQEKQSGEGRRSEDVSTIMPRRPLKDVTNTYSNSHDEGGRSQSSLGFYERPKKSPIYGNDEKDATQGALRSVMVLKRQGRPCYDDHHSWRAVSHLMSDSDPESYNASPGCDDHEKPSPLTKEDPSPAPASSNAPSQAKSFFRRKSDRPFLKPTPKPSQNAKSATLPPPPSVTSPPSSKPRYDAWRTLLPQRRHTSKASNMQSKVASPPAPHSGGPDEKSFDSDEDMVPLVSMGTVLPSLRASHDIFRSHFYGQPPKEDAAPPTGLDTPPLSSEIPPKQASGSASQSPATDERCRPEKRMTWDMRRFSLMALESIGGYAPQTVHSPRTSGEGVGQSSNRLSAYVLR